MFTIATWNVNSIRVRWPHILQWLEQVQPDVLALQETKVEDKDFPLDDCRQAGYEVAYVGQKSYNGVAVLSRLPMEEVMTTIPAVDGEQKRTLGVTVQGIRIWDLYVPNGFEVGSDKYDYKLNWLLGIKQYFAQVLAEKDNLLILGDFNIAPADEDVCDPKAWEGKVLVSEAERDSFQALLALGFADCFRLFSQPERIYSWWNYRQLAFRRNRGLRIDHILASPALAERCVKCWIDKEPRKWERPSDHAPVIAQFDQ